MNATASDPDTTVSTPPANVQLVDFVPLRKVLSAIDKGGKVGPLRS